MKFYGEYSFFLLAILYMIILIKKIHLKLYSKIILYILIKNKESFLQQNMLARQFFKLLKIK